MLKQLGKVLLILIALTAFSNFVTTWFSHPESSVLHPEEFVRVYGDSLFANPLFWLIITLMFVWVVWKLLVQKGGK